MNTTTHPVSAPRTRSTGTRRPGLIASLALVTAAVVLAGCSGPSAAAPHRQAPRVDGPTATQAMVCGDEIKGVVRQVLHLPATPTPTSTMANGKFTCTYQLPMGPMVLSVQHSTSDRAGLDYLTTRATTVEAHDPLIGLTAHALGSSTGLVLVLKDNETLEVDTTGLPETIGDEEQKRTDLAYELASNVLGCWTGHEEPS